MTPQLSTERAHWKEKLLFLGLTFVVENAPQRRKGRVLNAALWHGSAPQSVLDPCPRPVVALGEF